MQDNGEMANAKVAKSADAEAEATKATRDSIAEVKRITDSIASAKTRKAK
jgi:hypothetical protein